MSKIDDEEIKNKLKEQGYSNRSINYQEFLQLYEPYKNELKEGDFASILDISLKSLHNIKYQNTKTIILKKTQISLERIEEIKNSLIKQGFSNHSINYQEFLKLYEPYKNEMTEKDFANILGIAKSTQCKLKKLKTKTKILKTHISVERIEEIKNSLIDQGFSNRKIDYQEFLRLYEPYKNEMTEKDFANILEISQYNLHNLKNLKTNAIILKTHISEIRKEEIRNSLINQGFFNRKINYQEFLQLYEPYKNEMKESDFANILGILNSTMCNLKKLKTNAIILNTHISLERIEEIKNALINQGLSNSKIDYQEFLQLYEPYKNEMTKKDFANTLGISYNNLYNMKNKHTNTIILKTHISEIRKEEIRNILINQGYSNHSINYQEFLQLYEPYKNELKEGDFASILDISIKSLHNIKYQKTKTIILKTQISLEKIEEIKNSLINQGLSNTKINYQEFLQLYEPYKNEMIENDFANILGLSSKNLYSIRNQKTNTIILKTHISLERIEEIRNILINQGFSNHKIDYQEFLNLYEPYKNEIKEGDFANILGLSHQKLYRLKNQNKKTTILKTHIPLERIEEIKNSLINQGLSNTQIDYQEFLRLYEPYKNEMTENDFANILGIAKSTKCNLKKLKTKTKILKSLDETISKDNETSYHEIFSSKDNKEKIIDQREEKNLNQENIITEMKTFFDNGLSNQETMNIIMKKYNLNKEELLEILNLELDKKNKLKTDNKGNFYLGEEL